MQDEDQYALAVPEYKRRTWIGLAIVVVAILAFMLLMWQQSAVRDAEIEARQTNAAATTDAQIATIRAEGTATAAAQGSD